MAIQNTYASPSEPELPSWLAWALPVAGLASLGLVIAVLAITSLISAPIGANGTTSLLLASLLISGASGVTGLLLSCRRQMEASTRVLAVIVSLMAIGIPVGFVLWALYALAFLIKC